MLPTTMKLRAGDVLLMRSRFWLSTLMAWNAECPWSHAAILVDRGELVEAVRPRVRTRALAALLADTRAVACIDVFRPLNPHGAGLRVRQLRRLTRGARAFVGAPFALGRMPWLALDTLMRHKLGRRKRLSRIERCSGLSCTELVYRVLAQATDVVPRMPEAILPGDLGALAVLHHLGRIDSPACVSGSLIMDRAPPPETAGSYPAPCAVALLPVPAPTSSSRRSPQPGPWSYPLESSRERRRDSLARLAR